MRLSGWLVGLVVLGMMIAAAAVCALVAYTGTRDVVIDLQRENNILVESPGEVIQIALGVLNPADFVPTAATEVRTPSPSVVVIASPTPMSEISQSTPETGSTATLSAPVAFGTAVTTPDVNVTLTWEDPRQVRILLMGIDQRSATGETGPFRTDTMILVNIDPVRKTVGLISLPRDLWVTIPNFQPERINTANFIGDVNAYPGGGAALAMETVAQNFGIRVDKYILVNFDAFTAAVNVLAPNGVEICVRELIDDPDYPDAGFGIIPIRFEPGCQRLDAEKLLQYARTRATQGGDFDRAQRQQEVLDALRAELLNAGGVVNFIGQATTLWDELSGSFKTNLTLEDLFRLGGLVSEIERDDIHGAVIDNNYVSLGSTATGDQILIPQSARISDLIQRVFFPQAEISLAELKTRADAERAPIAVYNGTDIAGLARSTGEWLAGRGVIVTEYGNLPVATNADTVIKDYDGNPWTARYLAALLNLPPERIQPGTDGLIATGVMIVVGPDIQTLLAGGN